MKVFELNALSRVIFSTGMDGISCYVLLTGEDGELVELDEKTVGIVGVGLGTIFCGCGCGYPIMR